ncbi:MAG: catalase/peroxidase HPI [Azospirillum brasilense]|nr:MAG: catalase/peroxidase HPI [Azospirillum brasilense]
MTPKSPQFWWPQQLDLSSLRQNDAASNPYGRNFDYAKEFATLDLEAVKKDINTALTTSQPWWPADYGNYGPFFIRMAWHSAGTYRLADGRGGAAGGQQRFEPLNSWPDNANLDKARRLLWPIKQKYGEKISWADLMVLTGNVALENMGFTPYGFAGGRADDWEPDLVYWGAEKFLADNRNPADKKLAHPLAATQMGLIYVNPEGPNGNHDPKAAAHDIREAFGRMAMNDEETLALVAGGHTFGKAHGAKKPQDCVGAEPAAEKIEAQGLGWHNTCGKGNAEDTTTSGLEGAWTSAPTEFTMQYLNNLFDFEWVQTKSPAGATQWVPKDAENNKTVPDAHVKGKLHAPIMFTTDLALKEDPEYRKIALRFKDNPEEFKAAFAKAWFKLTHRDMGPRWRYLGAEVPKQELTWQDPIPAVDYALITPADAATLKGQILASELSVPELVRVAWASAASFRGTDMRGGANGARVALAPQKDWEANNPEELATVLAKLEEIRTAFNSSLGGGKKISLADTIVLAGNAAIEKAAKDAGYSNVSVPFTPGRNDTTQELTDVDAFAVLEPKADGFRNYYGEGNDKSPAEALVERAGLLNLSVPEMTVLVGGLRTLGATHGDAKEGVFTATPGTLSQDFFTNLLSMDTVWKPAEGKDGVYVGTDRASGEQKWTATPVDLIFGSNSELRAVAEVYASDDAKQKFLTDFIAAWTKVMNNDRPNA